MILTTHYKAVADVIASVTLMAMEPEGGTIGTPEHRETLRSGVDIARGQIARDLADYFEQDSMQFDREKFLKACGIN